MRRGRASPSSRARPQERDARASRCFSPCRLDLERRGQAGVGDAGQVDGVDVRCEASGGASSSTKPVSRLTTPPGRSDVASTSPSVTDGSGRLSLATTTAVLPLTDDRRDDRDQPEQRRLLRGDHGDHAGRLRHREVEARTGDRVGGPASRPAGTCPHHPAYQTQRSMAASTAAVARLAVQSFGRLHLVDELATDGPPASPPRGRAPGRGCTPSPPTTRPTRLVPRTTASCSSLREARSVPARKRPLASTTSYERPLSERVTCRPRRACTSCGRPAGSLVPLEGRRRSPRRPPSPPEARSLAPRRRATPGRTG